MLHEQVLDPSQSGALEMPPGSNESLAVYDSRVIECVYDQQRDKWIFMRDRTDDKGTPNADSVYFKVSACRGRDCGACAAVTVGQTSVCYERVSVTQPIVLRVVIK